MLPKPTGWQMMPPLDTGAASWSPCVAAIALRRLRELLTTLARYRSDMADRQCGLAQRVMRIKTGLLRVAGAMGRHLRDRATIVFLVLLLAGVAEPA